MSDQESVFLYLTTRGRTSGQPRTIEIWFVEREGRYYLAAENRERAQWVQNLQADPAVELSVGTRAERGRVLAATKGSARVLDVGDDAALVTAVRGLMDAKYDWSDGLIVELTLTSRNRGQLFTGLLDRARPLARSRRRR